MDWSIKWRLLVGGPILIVLGLVLYVVRGVVAALGLAAVGVILLIIGVVWNLRRKETKVT